MSDCRGIVVGLFGFTVFELVEWFSGLGSSPGGRANHFHTRYLRFCAWLAGFRFPVAQGTHSNRALFSHSIRAQFTHSIPAQFALATQAQDPYQGPERTNVPTGCH